MKEIDNNKCPKCESDEILIISRNEYIKLNKSLKSKIEYNLFLENDHINICKKCTYVFGYNLLIFLEKITSFHFHIGNGLDGYHVLDINKNNDIIEAVYKYITFGNDYENKKFKKIENDIVNINIEISEWRKYIKKIIALDIINWKKIYEIDDVCDGTYWGLHLKIKKRYF